jgi:hypothetical protein
MSDNEGNFKLFATTYYKAWVNINKTFYHHHEVV